MRGAATGAMKVAEPGVAVLTRRLVKRYGRTAALAGVELRVPEGAAYVLVGPNGAGKTTLMGTLLDLVVPTSGDAAVFGLDARRDGPRVRSRIGYVPERDDATYGWLRVGAMIRYHAGYYAAWDAGYAAELSRLFDIRPDARFGKLSKGQQRRVQLLLAMAHRPRLLLLDEPMDGLDPVMRDRTLAALSDHLARFPTTLLVSTHQVHDVERLGDHLGVMHAGRLDPQLDRDALRRRLRRYRFQPPPAWPGAGAFGDAGHAGDVVARDDAGRESTWTIWGDEADVVARLRAAGAAVRRVDALTLEEAALALLAHLDPTPATLPGPAAPVAAILGG